jgi:hypothetical protein
MSDRDYSSIDRADLLRLRALEIETRTAFFDHVDALRVYLLQGRTLSARLLALKAVVMLEPLELLGVVIWPLPIW